MVQWVAPAGSLKNFLFLGKWVWHETVEQNLVLALLPVLHSASVALLQPHLIRPCNVRKLGGDHILGPQVLDTHRQQWSLFEQAV